MIWRSRIGFSGSDPKIAVLHDLSAGEYVPDGDGVRERSGEDESALSPGGKGAIALCGGFL